MKGDKILIVGASILQMPAIKRAKEMGLTTAVADYNPNAVGIRFADEYYNCSTLDKDGMLNVVEKFCPDGIMTMATDLPMRTIAHVCMKKNLVGISEECALNCTDKIQMIRCFKENGVPSPNFEEITDLSDLQNKAEFLQFPAIMKPADNSGSRGVVLVHNIEDCLAQYDYVYECSHNGKILIEEYLSGPEVSVETFVVGGKAHVLQVTDKVTTGAPYFVELGHSQPSMLNQNIIEKITAVADSACRAVGLINGPAHLEMIITEGEPKMVEMGARMGGDCITSHLVPLSTGIDMTEQTIRYCLGLPVNFNEKLHMGSAVCFLTARAGRIKDIQGVERAYRIDGVKEVGFFKQVGEEVAEIHSSSDRIGYVIVQKKSAKDAIAACKKAASKIKIHIA